MWIRLKKPYAVTFPGRTEPAGSVHSVGNPKGQKLIAAGIAEKTLSPREQDEGGRGPSLTSCHGKRHKEAGQGRPSRRHRFAGTA
jgi:hypothetical protein